MKLNFNNRIFVAVTFSLAKIIVVQSEMEYKFISI